MNKKILLAAMALPMLFTACSQDELIDTPMNGGMVAPEVRGFDITLNPTLDATTRAIWDNTYARLDWEKTDLMSVYWLGNQESEGAGTGKALKGMFNSIFKTEDGNSFTSESLVFEGGNIAVFPGDVDFTSQGDIKLSITNKQDESILKKVPYISNYLNIQALADDSKRNEQLPGYNKGLYSPMKMVPNILYLTLDLANTAKLTENYDFKIESVVLAPKDAAQQPAAVSAFTKEAVLKIAVDDVNTATVDESLPYDRGQVFEKIADPDAEEPCEDDSIYTITKQVRAEALAGQLVSELSTTNITKISEGKYLVKFVILPTGNTAIDKYSEIVINTNCGTLTLTSAQADSAEDDLDKTAKFTYPDEDSDDEYVYAGVVTGKTNVVTVGEETKKVPYNQTITEMLEEVVAYQIMPEGEISNFIGEQIGRPYARTITGDMANATLNNSKVYNSTDIKNYIAIHTAMNSNEIMNLVLSSEVEAGKPGCGTFSDLTSEALKLLDAKNTYAAQGVTESLKVTLSAGAGIDTIQLSTVGAVYAPNAYAWKGENAQYKLTLPAGAWTMNDTFSNTTVEKIINNGTLTIAGTADKDGNQKLVAAAINNQGTLKIGGTTNMLKMNGNFENSGTIELVKGNEFQFAGEITEGLEGTIEVPAGARLTAAANVSVTTEATINNSGTVAAEAGNGGFVNAGTINVKANNSITYVQDNAAGVINLNARNNSVVVYQDKGKIVYNYNYATDGAQFIKKASDKFTYVIFDDKVETLNLNDATDAPQGATYENINNVSLEFNGTTALTTDGVEIYDLIVNKGADLQLVDESNKLTCHSLINNGLITIGGYIWYTYDYTGNGRILSYGNGSINKSNEIQAALQNSITAAINAADGSTTGTQANPVQVSVAENVILDSPLVFDGGTTLAPTTRADVDATEPATIYVTLDLNGKTIQAKKHAIVVDNGYHLTINGEGTVHGAFNNNNSGTAVFAWRGGQVVINGGHYMVGNDGDNRNDCIYATGNSTIEINDGKFEYVGKTAVETVNGGNKYGHQFLLNCLDGNAATITVKGGSFKNHVPGIEAVGAGEVILGTDKAVYLGSTAVTEAHSGTATKWYTVK